MLQCAIHVGFIEPWNLHDVPPDLTIFFISVVHDVVLIIVNILLLDSNFVDVTVFETALPTKADLKI